MHDVPPVLLITEEKGGVGKTILAVNIASFAMLNGVRAKLVDCNARQGSATSWAQRHPAGSRVASLTCAPVHGRLTLPRLAEIAGDAQVLIVDGMPYLGKELQHAAACADAVLQPLRPGQFDLDAAEHTCQALDVADQTRGALGKPKLRRLVCLTQSVGRSNGERDAIELLKGRPRWGEYVGCVRFRDVFRLSAGGGSVFELARPDAPAIEEATTIARAALGALGLAGAESHRRAGRGNAVHAH